MIDKNQTEPFLMTQFFLVSYVRLAFFEYVPEGLLTPEEMRDAMGNQNQEKKEKKTMRIRADGKWIKRLENIQIFTFVLWVFAFFASSMVMCGDSFTCSHEFNVLWPWMVLLQVILQTIFFSMWFVFDFSPPTIDEASAGDSANFKALIDKLEGGENERDKGDS